MAVIAPPTITPPPTRPDRADPNTFPERADAWTLWERDHQMPELTALGENVAHNATETITAVDTAMAAGLANAATNAASAAADRAQTGLDRVATGQDRTQTGLDRAAVAAALESIADGPVASVGGATGVVTLKTLNGQALVGTGNIVIDSSIYRDARTANTALTAADKGKFVDITSGTFTQTFAAAATLGNGWYVYLRNGGTGDITLDPNGAELIDGLSSYIMYPGEVRLVMCDGTALRSIVLNAFYKEFATSQAFIKPPGYSVFQGILWPGGNGGNGGANGSSSGGGAGGHGGSGGGATPFTLRASTVSASTSVSVGAGGVGGGAGAGGGAGGITAFGALVASTGTIGTQGGYYDGAASAANGGVPEGAGSAGQNAKSGGGSGGGGPSGTSSTPKASGAGGVSLLAGNGGAGALGAAISTNGNTGSPGVAPGGGGGGGGGGSYIATGSTTGGTGGAGGRGELRLWGVI